MLRGEMRIRTNAAELRNAGDQYAKDFVTEHLTLARDKAKHNVSPGVGPGPHPHRPYPFPQHEDTGQLASNVEIVVERTLTGFAGIMYTPLKYGADLEVGWTSDAGNFYRYPWMRPAFEWALSNISRSGVRFNLRGALGRFV